MNSQEEIRKANVRKQRMELFKLIGISAAIGIAIGLLSLQFI
jgi:ElaB/YqjD/DUF883 family membrane-anchored ribosome-binding protein